MSKRDVLTRCSLATLLLGLVYLGGCSAVGEMPIEYDTYARELRPAEDEALVYIVRPSGMGRVSKFLVTCDGDSIGATGGGRYIFTLQKPGAHVFVSEAENDSELPIVLEGGRTYYLEQKIKMGLMSARNNLERLSDAEGIEKLADCTLSEEIVAHIPGSEEYMEELRRKKAEAAASREIYEDSAH